MLICPQTVPGSCHLQADGKAGKCIITLLHPGVTAAAVDGRSYRRLTLVTGAQIRVAAGVCRRRRCNNIDNHLSGANNGTGRDSLTAARDQCKNECMRSGRIGAGELHGGRGSWAPSDGCTTRRGRSIHDGARVPAHDEIGGVVGIRAGVLPQKTLYGDLTHPYCRRIQAINIDIRRIRIHIASYIDTHLSIQT